GYHSVPRQFLPGFGHVGLGGSFGWADPASGVAVSFAHSRLATSLPIDQVAFTVLYLLAHRAAARARKDGFTPIADFGAPFTKTPAASTA
ncbi:MAG: esterase, partial [Mycobacterium sp.]